MEADLDYIGATRQDRIIAEPGSFIGMVIERRLVRDNKIGVQLDGFPDDRVRGKHGCHDAFDGL